MKQHKKLLLGLVIGYALAIVVPPSKFTGALSGAKKAA